jgi:hypothetical protein
MNYPTLEEVEAATLLQLCTWQRFLPSPGAAAMANTSSRHSPLEAARVKRSMDEEVKVMQRIVERVIEMGGFSPEISKEIGWEQ